MLFFLYIAIVLPTVNKTQQYIDYWLIYSSLSIKSVITLMLIMIKIVTLFVYSLPTVD